MADSIYTIGFSADTSKVKTQLKDLQTQLSNLVTNTTGKSTNMLGGLSNEMINATQTAAQLKIHLQEATNVKTGKLDISRFIQQMDKGGMNLTKYQQALSQLGPEGDKAFASLARSLSMAELPLRRSNKLLNEMAISLKNTIKWQLSSSAIHAFMGTIQSAYGYAKDLNESLNNIRIVTGKSTDEMAEFAQQANKAAKSLSTTTTSYTDAALIYYQQGLSDKDVLERADVTVKMANVSRQSAEIVSEQMTAVWNNFDDGSKSLEYYADVMTALGAATASSSDEIAQGLEKFSAIADTVGLSYEYATAALATVTATTRQSADVVGNSFKTIFARLQGLQQGETQDDGVTLNKYSEALQNVGISIFESNGQLKEMDNILNELGAKWETLGEAEQVALAQTVGGVRQYAQLIALMDNWDFFQENLQTAYSAEGSLQEQANIYAESWEASSKRVKAAAEEIYDTLLNDEFFISLNNIFADIITGINQTIKGLGGFKGVLLLIGNIMTTVFQKQLATNLDNLKYSFMGLTKAGKERALQLRTEANEKMINQYFDSDDTYGRALGATYKDRSQLQLAYIQNAKKMNDEEKKLVELLLDQYDIIGKKVEKSAEEAIELEKITKIEENRLSLKMGKDPNKEKAGKWALGRVTEAEQVSGKATQMFNYLLGPNANKDNLKDQASNTLTFLENNQISQGKYNLVNPELIKSQENLIEISKAAKEGKASVEEWNEAYNKYLELLNSPINKGFNVDKAWEGLKKSFPELSAELDELRNKARQTGEAVQGVGNDMHSAGKTALGMKEKIAGYGQASLNDTQKLVKSASLLSSVAMSMGSIKTIFNTLGDESLSLGEKISTLAMSFGMLIPVITRLMDETTLNSLFSWAGGGRLIAIIAAISTIIIIFKKIYEEIHKNELALKKLNEEFAETKKAADEATDSYKNLKSSLDELESSKDTLSQLKEGTLEWKQAVLELNQQVLNLLEKYPELNKYLSRNENGILSISEEGINQVLTSQWAEANALQQAASARQQKIRQEEYNQWKNNNNLNYGEIKVSDGGNLIKYNNNVISTDEQQDIIKALEENTDVWKETGKIDWKKMPEFYEEKSLEYKNAIEKNINSILALTNTIDQWDSEMRNINQNLASQWLDTSTRAAGIDKEYKEALSIGMSSALTDEYKKSIEEGIDDLNKDELYKYYADAIGSTEEIIKQNVDNEKLSLDDIKAYLANDVIQTESFKKVEDTVDSLNLVEGLGADILKRIIASGGDESSYDTLTAEEVDELYKTINNDVFTELNEMTDWLGEGFGEKLRENLEKYNQEAADEKRYQQKLGSTASELGIDEEALESYVSYLTESNKELKENRELAIEAAEANIKFNNAAKKVHEVLEDNEDIFAAADESSWEYHEAIGKLTEAVGGLFGLEVDSDYVKNHFDDIKKAVNGDEEALRNLQETVAVDWAKNFVNNIGDVTNVSDKLKEQLDTSNWETNIEDWKSHFTEVIDDVASRLANSDDFTIEVNAETDKALADLIDLTNQAMAAGQMTEEQMKAMFASMGYSPEVDYLEKDGETITTETKGEMKLPFLGTVEYSGQSTNTSKLKVPIIKDANSDGKTSLNKISTPKMMASAAKKAPKSSGSSKDSKSMKKESERYHVIKEVIEDINHELDKLGEAKDRAFGSKKLKAIDDETAALENLLAAEKQYKKEVEDYYKKDKAAIAAYGAKFDENGIITNYEDLIQQQVNKYNASKTDEAEKAYEKFKEALEQYEETHDLLQDQEKKIRDRENKIRDSILEGIQTKVDIQIEVNDDDIAFLDHLLGNLEDSAYNAAEAIAYLGQQTAANLKSNEAYVQGINDIFASQGVADATDRFINGELTAADLKEMEFTEDEVAALKKYRDGLMETTEQLQEWRDTVWEEVMESLEELSEEFDEQSDVVDHLSGVLDHYRNIVDIVGQEALGISDDMMKMFSDVAVDSAIDNLAISVDKLEGLREARAEQERALAQATTDEEIKRWTETIEETDKLIRDAEENMLSNWEEALEAAAKAFEETVTRAISNFEKAMSGTFGNLDALQDAFDKQKELDDLYLDDYKQIYELSKLTRDINKSIDDIDNLAGKKALRDILTEINQLQEDGVELSEYDLNFLRAKYELRLAQIALEEAQNAKSQVRMTRDSEGNWSYTYTADQENIDTATQNYEDKLYAIQELSSNYIEEMESQILGLNQAMLDEIAGLDQNATDYMEQVNRITAFYQEKMAAYNDQINNALSNNKEIYDNDWTNYSNATGYKISANEDFIDNFAETTLSMLTGFQDMESYQQAFNDAIGHPDIEDSLLGQLTAGYNEWKNRVEIVMNEAGTSTDQFGKHMEDMAVKVDEETDKAALASEALKTNMQDVFGNIITTVQTFENQYSKMIGSMTANNSALVGALNQVFAAWSNVASVSGAALNIAKDYSQYAGGKIGPEELLDSIANIMEDYSDNPSSSRNQGGGMGGTRHMRFATGGYTGEWGPSGKWALLDEKELVLNASDTKNMLSIIGAVRDISRTIDLNTNGFGLGALVASGISSSESTLNQNVEIHAEFPNATNRGEIEAAFDNLINRASQYTNRKN